MIKNQPLAAYFRPQRLSDFVGQEKIIGPKTWLYQALKSDQVPSLIFWGPPGSGKTTLASIIAQETKAEFRSLSATASGLKDLKKIIDLAKEAKRLGTKTILFIDEIHRWNKAQQDALLPQVENGTMILIGATTENPSFSVNSALLSRAKVVVLEALTPGDLEKIIGRAAKELSLKLAADSVSLIARLAAGDARQALNILESAAETVVAKASGRAKGKSGLSGASQEIGPELIKDIMNKPNLLYDKNGDEHYNIISALHKSMRGGDADAAIYYVGRMLEAGEDPRYVARRLIRFASEDIGLANNSALMLATAAYMASEKTGLPECAVNLAHCAAYLAKSAKSIAVYQAYGRVQAEIRESGALPVPLHLRNAPTKLMKDLGYGRDYKYTPLTDDSGQSYLPEQTKNKKFFRPRE